MAYTVAPGASIHHAGGVLHGGDQVPAELLAAWGETGLLANIEAGAVLAPPEPEEPRRKDRGRDRA